MKKLICTLLALMCMAVFFNATNIRVARGEVISQTYIESADYISTCLTTTDGESWIAEGYIAPIGDKVLIIYDMCDKSTIYDDEIVYILHFTSLK